MLCKQAAARGDQQAEGKLRDLDAEELLPRDFWAPVAHIHKWCSDQQHTEMMCLLMAGLHDDCLVSLLPRGVLMNVCLYISCKPDKFDAKKVN